MIIISTEHNCDRQQIASALGNLVDNAVKYIRKDEGGKVSLICTSEKNFLVIEVVVNGSGIPPESLGNIFKPWWTTADSAPGSSTQPDDGGMGIGLFLVKDMITSMGGNISVDSVVGSGSRFKLTLPLNNTHILLSKKVSAGKDTKQEGGRGGGLEGDEGDGDNPGKGTMYGVNKSTEALVGGAESEGMFQIAQLKPGQHCILIADDAMLQRHFLKRFLDPVVSMEVIVACDGDDALSILNVARQRGAVVDLLLTDCLMPNMNGFELARMIRQMEDEQRIPPSERLHITGLTANVRSSVEQDCLESGMNDILVKPITSRDVNAHVQRVLQPAAGGMLSSHASSLDPTLTAAADEAQSPSLKSKSGTT